MANVFLSYDHEDIALAKPIASALGKAGHTVWYDRHIHGGAQYSHQIEQALDAADAVIVIWSERSVNSAWVRDEAAEGRDRGKLVPLIVGGVSAPMGFRQFQTISLGAWKGRGKVPQLESLLQAVESQTSLSPSAPHESAQAIASPLRAAPTSVANRWPAVAAVIAILISGSGYWWWSQKSSLPVVEVAAANSSPRSQAAASDLYVKLGSLAQVGQGKWQLVDASAQAAKADLLFRTADVGSPSSPRANLVLLDKDQSLLWSREFAAPAGGSEADLREQVSVNAGRVLTCALDSRDHGGLSRPMLKLFLTACAALPEASYEEQVGMAAQLRSIARQNPKFKPAWEQLLMAQLTVADFAKNQSADETGLKQLSIDANEARASFPNLAQATLADVRLLPNASFAEELRLHQKAASQAPDDPEIIAELKQPYMRVGRMNDAVAAARRAVQLDPLSAQAQTQLVLMLAYGGQIDAARDELAKAERVWPGSGVVKDAQWAFNLRFGDPKLALPLLPQNNSIIRNFLIARLDPSPENVARVVANLRPVDPDPTSERMSFAVQALGQFDQIDDAFAWMAQTSPARMADASYVLFRPALVSVRRDPRFISVANRIGLLKFWRRSNQWPDFCDDSNLPYDCKAEAAKYAP